MGPAITFAPANLELRNCRCWQLAGGESRYSIHAQSTPHGKIQVCSMLPNHSRAQVQSVPVPLERACRPRKSFSNARNIHPGSIVDPSEVDSHHSHHSIGKIGWEAVHPPQYVNTAFGRTSRLITPKLPSQRGQLPSKDLSPSSLRGRGGAARDQCLARLVFVDTWKWLELHGI